MSTGEVAGVSKVPIDAERAIAPSAGGWVSQFLLGYDPKSSVVVIGMPSSGKSTYLWALSESMSRIDRNKSVVNGWCYSDTKKELDVFAREFTSKIKANIKSQTTGKDYKELPLFSGWKAYLGWVPFALWRYEVCSPDVPGEWIRALANQEETPADGLFRVEYQRFRRLLRDSPAVIVMVDCCVGENWQDALETQLKDFQMLFNSSMAESNRYRSVCVVLAKADELVNKFSERNNVQLPTELSYCASWCQPGEGLIQHHDGVTSFNIASNLDAESSKDQVNLHMALALDYLRAHAPAVANILTNMIGRADLKMTVMFGSSIGIRGTHIPGERKLKCENPINLFLPFSWTMQRLGIVRLRGLLFRFFMVTTIIIWIAMLVKLS